MSSPRAIRLSRKADNDLAGIMSYTQREWGKEQWITYRRALTAGFNRVAEFPELGEHRSEIAVGVRSIRIEMHVAYYRVTPKTIRILRVRHIRAALLSSEDL